MTLHFAYGSNMSRPLMRARCPGASALGTASLAGWRFVINPDGFASIALHPGGRVHGVLWRLSPRDLAALNAYEALDSSLYLARTLPVRRHEQAVAALVYIACRRGEGRPRPGYMNIILDAARDWELPERYIRSLWRWSPSGWRGARLKDTGEVG
jgi:cation transport regulator ChaC